MSKFVQCNECQLLDRREVHEQPKCKLGSKVVYRVTNRKLIYYSRECCLISITNCSGTFQPKEILDVNNFINCTGDAS